MLINDKKATSNKINELLQHLLCIQLIKIPFLLNRRRVSIALELRNQIAVCYTTFGVSKTYIQMTYFKILAAGIFLYFDIVSYFFLLKTKRVIILKLMRMVSKFIIKNI